MAIVDDVATGDVESLRAQQTRRWRYETCATKISDDAILERSDVGRSLGRVRDLDVECARAGRYRRRTQVRVHPDAVEGKFILGKIEPVVRQGARSIESEVQVQNRHVPEPPRALGELRRKILDSLEEPRKRHGGDHRRVTAPLHRSRAALGAGPRESRRPTSTVADCARVAEMRAANDRCRRRRGRESSDCSRTLWNCGRAHRR